MLAAKKHLGYYTKKILYYVHTYTYVYLNCKKKINQTTWRIIIDYSFKTLFKGKSGGKTKENDHFITNSLLINVSECAHYVIAWWAWPRTIIGGRGPQRPRCRCWKEN